MDWLLWCVHSSLIGEISTNTLGNSSTLAMSNTLQNPEHQPDTIKPVYDLVVDMKYPQGVFSK